MIALNDRFPATRDSLHRVAEELVAPARKPHNEIGLMALPGGFGTPRFQFEGAEWQIRVDGRELVVEERGDERRERLTTIVSGAGLIGEALFPDGVPTDETPLDIDEESSRALAGWYALGDSVLQRLRAEWAADSPSEAILWPEHFDIAIESGDEAAGLRANYGFSPGDEGHGEPYLYVGPWSAEVSGELWNGRSFNGAELGYAELAAAADPLTAALEFCRARRDALTG